MTKVADLEFKTRLLTDEEATGFEGLEQVSTAVIDNGFPFMIAVICLPKENEEDSFYDILFFDSTLNKPIPVREVIAENILNEISCKRVSDFSIIKLDESTANNIIEVAETFGDQLKDYLDTIGKFRDKITTIPKTIQ